MTLALAPCVLLKEKQDYRLFFSTIFHLESSRSDIITSLNRFLTSWYQVAGISFQGVPFVVMLPATISQNVKYHFLKELHLATVTFPEITGHSFRNRHLSIWYDWKNDTFVIRLPSSDVTERTIIGAEIVFKLNEALIHLKANPGSLPTALK